MEFLLAFSSACLEVAEGTIRYIDLKKFNNSVQKLVLVLSQYTRMWFLANNWVTLTFLIESVIDKKIYRKMQLFLKIVFFFFFAASYHKKFNEFTIMSYYYTELYSRIRFSK